MAESAGSSLEAHLPRPAAHGAYAEEVTSRTTAEGQLAFMSKARACWGSDAPEVARLVHHAKMLLSPCNSFSQLQQQQQPFPQPPAASAAQLLHEKQQQLQPE